MKTRKIVMIDFLNESQCKEYTLATGDWTYHITEHGIGWDFTLGEELIRKYDGYADAIALSGVQKSIGIGKDRILHPGTMQLLKVATKTPIALSDELRNIFAEWSLQKVLKAQPLLFQGKKTLLHCGLVTSFLTRMEEAGAKWNAADALTITQVPTLLKGRAALTRFFKLMVPVMSLLKFNKVTRLAKKPKEKNEYKLAEWVSNHDIFVSFDSLLRRMESLDCLEGKTLIVDYISETTAKRLKGVHLEQIIEFRPTHSRAEQLNTVHISVLATMIELSRQDKEPGLSFEEYVLRWIQENPLTPRVSHLNKQPPVRVAFVIHPLSQNDLWRHPKLKFLEKIPKEAKKWVEKASARAPVTYYGSITGIKSESNGQEVIVDLLMMGATPREMMKLPEEAVYDRIVKGFDLAKERGALMGGLGAYTKIVGDGGVTISKRSKMPVTSGNSYSASTTLWGARVMVEKMGLIPTSKPGERLNAKAMVIGATGSIGKVSAQLIAMVFKEVVLVATRPDKLLELRDELLKANPGINVRITTHGNHELVSTDLIVMATSSLDEELIDIERVKPGAVICDCSRPFNVSEEQALSRPDVLVVHSGEILLPGDVKMNVDIGLPQPTVYACLAETALLAMEGRFEPFSLSRNLSMNKVKEIYQMGIKHGAKLSEIQGPFGIVTDSMIEETRKQALKKLKQFTPSAAVGLTIDLENSHEQSRKLL